MKQITNRWTLINDNDLFFVHQLKDTDIIVGFWPTIFGCRVRAGHLGQMCYALDYCGAMNLGALVLMYNRVIERITYNIDQGQDPWHGFVQQVVKPIQKDRERWLKLLDVGDYRFSKSVKNLDLLISQNRFKLAAL